MHYQPTPCRPFYFHKASLTPLTQGVAPSSGWVRTRSVGALCLVAWDRCCRPRSEGGLGLRNLAIQNQCLLLKLLLHRIHSLANSAWASWIRHRIDIVTITGDISGSHWTALRSLLPTYRAITTVNLHDGHSTSFWDDVWLPAGALVDAYPALHSHCTSQSASVHQIIRDGLAAHLVPRLSQTAQEELAEVQLLLDDTELLPGLDVRHSPFLDSSGTLRSTPVYKAMMQTSSATCPYAKFVWENRAPPRARCCRKGGYNVRPTFCARIS